MGGSAFEMYKKEERLRKRQREAVEKKTIYETELEKLKRFFPLETVIYTVIAVAAVIICYCTTHTWWGCFAFFFPVCYIGGFIFQTRFYKKRITLAEEYSNLKERKKDENKE